MSANKITDVSLHGSSVVLCFFLRTFVLSASNSASLVGRAGGGTVNHSRGREGLRRYCVVGTTRIFVDRAAAGGASVE
jgi:hypothetical protein